MSDTGIVRRIDDLGRIVIPMEIRRMLGMKVRDPLSIVLDGDRVIVSKHHDACVVCGTIDESMIEIKGRPVCADCAEEIKRA